MTTTAIPAAPPPAPNQRVLTDIFDDLALHLLRIKEGAKIIGDASLNKPIDKDLYGLLWFCTSAILDCVAKAEACSDEAQALCDRLSAVLKDEAGGL